ncbi:MAG: terminase family protein [Holosporales bacterium]|jgi:phage terminase large subunit-like protein|nr:terminase family protein [Holosporales bacterium]
MRYIQNWHEIARKEQRLPEGNWMLWLLLAGRGFGKTKTGAETIMELVNSGKYKNIGIIGKSIREAKDIMIDGPSGLLSTTIAEKHFSNVENRIEDETTVKFRYYPSKNQIIWANGAKAHVLGADHSDRLRGYQFDLIWIDEFAKFKNPDAIWQQILFTLRIGQAPRCIITTTPRPLKILKQLTEAKFTYLTKGSTLANAANLAPRFLETIVAMYQNTRVGKQELEGELLMEKENTVWKREHIVYRDVDRDRLTRVVIGVDPAVSSGANSDETGIIVAGLGYDGKIYILADLSGKYKPPDWAKVVCRAYHDYKAGRIVAETNNGGDLVKAILETVYPNLPFNQVHAIKGKIARAEPVALLYESNKVFHADEFFELEDQMCNLSYDDNGDRSPDRVDALVWAISELKDRTCLPNITVI